MSRLETVNVVMSEARQEIIKCEYVQPKSGNDIDPPSPSPNIIGVTWPCEMENLLLIPRSTGEFDFWWSALLFQTRQRAGRTNWEDKILTILIKNSLKFVNEQIFTSVEIH